jgi:hypothetical protein
MHDTGCGGVCQYPGCREDCVYADCSCDGKHVCSKHANMKFEPERRAKITITVEGKGTVSIVMPLSATIEYDNLLNTARAADQLAYRAFMGPWDR